MQNKEICSITVLTAAPELFVGVLNKGLLGKGIEKKIWSLNIVDIKDFGLGKNKKIDDKCYGGGPGMLYLPEVVDQALHHVMRVIGGNKIIHLSPRGKKLDQNTLVNWAKDCQSMILIASKYEGIDVRVIQEWNIEEISIGDFVSMGGEIPAMLLIESYIRLIPGIIGNPNSLIQESFSDGYLEHDQYTRPKIWKNKLVPDVLLSGNHDMIKQWKKENSQMITRKRRLDLLEKIVKK